MPLCVPSIVGPVSAWNQSLLIEGGLPGATIIVSEGAPDDRIVLKAVAPGGYARLALLPGTKLTAGARLFVRQELDEASGWTESALAQLVGTAPTSYGDLVPLSFRSKVYPCGGALWLSGATPGSEVVIATESGALLGSGLANEGEARINLAQDIPFGAGHVQAHERAPAGMPGLGGVVVHASESILALPVPAGSRLPPPVIGEPAPLGCDATLVIRNVVDGATVTVERPNEGIVETARFDLSALTLILQSPLAAGGGSLTVTQAIGPRCAVEPSEAVKVDFGPAAQPGAPKPSPPCGGSSFLHVTNLKPGAAIAIDVGGTVYRGHVTLAGTRQTFELGPMAEGQAISVVQSACGLDSEPGTTVVGPNLAVDQPLVAEPLYQCARVVRVTGVTPGAMVRVFSKGQRGESQISAAVWCAGNSVAVPVTPYLKEGRDIRAEVTACGALPVSSPSVKVKATPEVLPVSIEQPFATQERVVVDAIPGAKVTVFSRGVAESADPEQIGEGLIDPVEKAIRLTRPLVENESLFAIQQICGQISRIVHTVEVKAGEHKFVLPSKKTWYVANEPEVEGVVWEIGELTCRIDGSFEFFGLFENLADKSYVDVTARVQLDLGASGPFGAVLDIMLAGADPEEPNNAILVAQGYEARDTATRSGVYPPFRNTATWLQVLAATPGFAWEVAVRNFPEFEENEEQDGEDDDDSPPPPSP